MDHLITAFFTCFNMGGYECYIYAAYGLMLAIFLLCLGLPLRQFRRIKAKLRSRY